MKKRIFACVVAIVMISVLCSGCAFDEVPNKTGDMFEYIGYNSKVNARIVYDTETKVMYATFCDSTMTLLVDEDGKPKLWKGSAKND